MAIVPSPAPNLNQKHVAPALLNFLATTLSCLRSLPWSKHTCAASVKFVAIKGGLRNTSVKEVLPEAMQTGVGLIEL